MIITEKMDWDKYDKFVNKRRTIGNAEFREFLEMHNLNPPKKYCWYCGSKINGRGIFY